MNYIKETFYNLFHGVWWKWMMSKYKELGFWRWLLYELNPAWYTENPRKFASFFREWEGLLVIHPMKGIAVSFLGFSIARLTPMQDFLLVIGVSTTVEIIQFLRAKASYFIPINTLLDIATWGSGFLIFYQLNEF